MIRSILAASVAHRYAVILVTLIAAAFGAWALVRLPIDAVPDVTNNQVQINVVAPALTPVEIERQVTVLVERALAGTPNLESMRSFSRNGFAQLTAVFSDRVDLGGLAWVIALSVTLVAVERATLAVFRRL